MGGNYDVTIHGGGSEYSAAKPEKKQLGPKDTLHKTFAQEALKKIQEKESANPKPIRPAIPPRENKPAAKVYKGAPPPVPSTEGRPSLRKVSDEKPPVPSTAGRPPLPHAATEPALRALPRPPPKREAPPTPPIAHRPNFISPPQQEAAKASTTQLEHMNKQRPKGPANRRLPQKHQERIEARQEDKEKAPAARSKHQGVQFERPPVPNKPLPQTPSPKSSSGSSTPSSSSSSSSFVTVNPSPSYTPTTSPPSSPTSTRKSVRQVLRGAADKLQEKFEKLQNRNTSRVSSGSEKLAELTKEEKTIQENSQKLQFYTLACHLLKANVLQAAKDGTLDQTQGILRISSDKTKAAEVRKDVFLNGSFSNKEFSDDVVMQGGYVKYMIQNMPEELRNKITNAVCPPDLYDKLQGAKSDELKKIGSLIYENVKELKEKDPEVYLFYENLFSTLNEVYEKNWKVVNPHSQLSHVVQGAAFMSELIIPPKFFPNDPVQAAVADSKAKSVLMGFLESFIRDNPATV